MEKPRRFLDLASRSRWQRCGLVLALLLGLLTIAARPDAAQQSCFEAAAGVEMCVDERFLGFWELHGGRGAFGRPVAAALEQATPDGSFTVQYFERARL